MADDAVVCAHCGGSYLPDGTFRTSWDAEMDRMAAARERKVERAEAFGRLGRPHTTFFLEERSGSCLLVVLAAIACASALAVALARTR